METIKVISSWQSILGLTVLAFFLFVFLVLSITFIVFAVTAKKGFRRERIYQAMLLLLVSVWMGSVMLPSFFQFTKVKILTDGTWILKNGWGIPLEKLTKETSRRVELYQKQVTWYGASYRRYKAATIYVVTDGRIYSSWTILPDEAEKLKNNIQNIIELQNIPASENTNLPFLFEKRLQQGKYVLYGVFFFVLIVVPFLLPKKEPIQENRP